MRLTPDRGARTLGRRGWHAGMAAAAAGLALAGATPELAIPIAAAVAALWLAVATPLRFPGLGLLVAVVLVGGAVVGTERLGAIDGPARALRPGAEISGRAVLLTPPRPSRFGWSAEIELEEDGVRLLARGSGAVRAPSPTTGDELEVNGRIDLPDRGGSFDWAAYLRRRGISRELDLSRVRSTDRRRGGLVGLRRRASARRRADHRPRVVRATRGAGQRHGPWPGRAHRAARSGRLPRLRPRAPARGERAERDAAGCARSAAARPGRGRPSRSHAVLLALIALYVPLAGAGPSLQRAGIMGAAGLVAIATARPASRSYALLLAAALTLAINPRAAGDPGWQLSFVAVAGIVWIAPLLRRPLQPLPRPLAEAAAITLGATLTTAPLVAFHFDRVPLAGVPANLLALPAIPVVMWAGMLLCAVGQLPPVVAEPATALVGVAATPAVDYLAWLARACAELPGGSLAPPIRAPIALAVAYAALGLFVLLLRRRAGNGTPAGRRAEVAAALRRMPARRRAVLAAALAAPLLLLVALALRPPGPPDRLTVRFLDVGQGDATLVQHPDGTRRALRRWPARGANGSPAPPRRRPPPRGGRGHPRLARPPRRPARGGRAHAGRRAPRRR